MTMLKGLQHAQACLGETRCSDREGHALAEKALAAAIASAESAPAVVTAEEIGASGARRSGVSTDDLYDADGVNVDTSQRFAKPPPPCRCGCWHASQGMPTDGALEGFRRWHREHP